MAYAIIKNDGECAWYWEGTEIEDGLRELDECPHDATLVVVIKSNAAEGE